MPEAVVFDTNTLPVMSGLDSVLWLTTRKVCAAAGLDLVIPEIVIHESVNLRRERFEPAAADYLKSYRAVAKFFASEPVYVPSADEICEAWEQELRSTFTVVPTHGEDAAEAMQREALRRRPARNGKGGRDSAIWLTVLRLSQQFSRVSFVSKNTEDFSVKGSAGLHPELAAEAVDAAGTIAYFTSIDDLIATVARDVEVETPDHASLLEALRFDLLDTVRAEARVDHRYGDLTTDAFDADGMTLAEVEVLRAFSIDDGPPLMLLRGSGSVPLGRVSDGNTLAFTFGAWIGGATDDAPASGELHDLTLTP